jgi:GNAT superfamily N-acetyltransferase
MMDEMIFRRAQPGDAPAIARLHALSWRTTYRGILRDEFLDGPLLENRLSLWGERLKDATAENCLILVGEHAGHIQAFACAFLDADPDWGTLLDNLHVVPRLKGGGLGRKLMSQVAEWVLRQESGPKMHLWAYADNMAARHFYERLGGMNTAFVAEDAPDGTTVNAVRYSWPDVSLLTQDLRGAMRIRHGI